MNAMESRRADPGDHGRQRWAWATTLPVLGVGYFLAYIPYSFLVKASTDGLLPGVPKVSGLYLLPVSAVATLVTTYAGLSLFGAWQHVGRRSIAGLSLPVPRLPVVFAGLCTAVIIASTTLAYAFPGVSIVVMMVLMRGGVLTIGRITDMAQGRRVHWTAIAGFLITGIAVLVGLFGGQDLTLGAAAAWVIGAYLAGYVVRFHVIQQLSKTDDASAAHRYIVEEQMVAMPALLLLCVLAAVGGPDDVQREVRAGFALLASGGMVLVPGLLVGVCYATLYVFGTLIYLHPREYTCCVPVNRASSILAGVIASVAITFLFGQPLPSASQFVGAGLLAAALFVIAWPDLRPRLARTRERAADCLILFVCSGNTARSPIAQALCAAALAERLSLSRRELAERGVTIASAGVRARVGAPMKPDAVAALGALGVQPHDHVARQFTPDLAAQASAVYCMTAEQVEQALAIAPHAAGKIRCLAAQDELAEPVGLAATLRFAQQARAAIHARFDDVLLHLGHLRCTT
jgi:protein-tyrosine-phosphatase